MDHSKQSTVADNIAFFHDNDHYIETQSAIEHYQHIKRIVERELRGINRLLDVGNGGFFNYDITLVPHVTAVDLFLNDGPGPHPNTVFRAGSLLALPFDDFAFDGILLQNVFHHITGKTVAENHANLRTAMRELYRCTEPGGRAIIIESTVGYLFYTLETFLFPPALAIKRGGHPVTFQFTARQLINAALASGYILEEFSYIPRGLYILQFGHKWPSMLTPACPIKLVLRRGRAS